MMFLKNNPNPKNKKTCDCVIRAIALIENMEYKQVAQGLFDVMLKSGYHIADKKCYDKYLESLGYVKCKQMKHSNGTLLSVAQLSAIVPTCLVNSRSHIACIKNGDVIDSWDCSKKKAGNYYVKKTLN